MATVPAGRKMPSCPRSPAKIHGCASGSVVPSSESPGVCFATSAATCLQPSAVGMPLAVQRTAPPTSPLSSTRNRSPLVGVGSGFRLATANSPPSPLGARRTSLAKRATEGTGTPCVLVGSDLRPADAASFQTWSTSLPTSDVALAFSRIALASVALEAFSSAPPAGADSACSESVDAAAEQFAGHPSSPAFVRWSRGVPRTVSCIARTRVSGLSFALSGSPRTHPWSVLHSPLRAAA